MVELALPKNSRLEDGKVWTKITSDQKAPSREFKIYSWSPDDDKNPRMHAYAISNEVSYIKPKARVY